VKEPSAVAPVSASAASAASVPSHRHIDKVRRRCKATMTAHCWRKGRKTHPTLPLRCQGLRRTHCNLHKLPASGASGHWSPRGEQRELLRDAALRQVFAQVF